MTTKEQLRRQWATRVVEYRASGLTMKVWCAAHDCSVDQLKYWLYKSRKHTPAGSATQSPAAHFVPLAVADEAKSTPLVLRVGPAQIELHAGFDARLLREVVHTLAEVVSC